MGMNMKSGGSIIGAGLVAAGLMVCNQANAAITFNFDFQGDFVGNATAQQAIVTAGNLFSNMFASHFSNTATLDFIVASENTGLAEAGSALQGPAGFGTADVVRNKVVTGIDSNGAVADGTISINLATPFVFDPNAPINFAAGEIDLFSVLDHELTHAFGFASYGTGATNVLHSTFDQFLTDKAGDPLFDSATLLVNQSAYDNALANGALFDGAHAIANYGSPVPIEGGFGAFSHLSTDAFSSPTVPQNALMLCCGGLNVQFEPRDYNSAEVGILADLGYTPTWCRLCHRLCATQG
jgi:hypothetical protein